MYNVPHSIPQQPRHTPGEHSDTSALPTTWHKTRVTVMGLGSFGGGVGLTRYLVHQGAHVTVTDLQGAEALARRALAKDDDDHHAMEVLARALIDQDRGVEAVQFARRIVEKRKKRVPYRLLLGDALLMIGDAAGARKEWQTALELEPGNREAKQRLQ